MDDRRRVTTTLSDSLIKNVRSIAALQGKNLNDLMEEAMLDLMKKYEETTDHGT